MSASTQLSLLDQPITGEVRVATEKVVALADRLWKQGNRLGAERLQDFIPADQKATTMTVTRELAVRYGLVDA